MSFPLLSPAALLSRMAALGLGLSVAASPALAETPHTMQFTDSIESFGVVRHTVPAVQGSTWAVSLDSRGADAQMFVSTEPSFRPHDAACAGDRTCTITVESASPLYVFVLAEGDVSYDVVATPTKVSASR